MNKRKISVMLIFFFTFMTLFSIQAFADEKTSKIILQTIPKVVAVTPAPGNQGSGSGVIIDPRGYIITNAHIVGPMKENEKKEMIIMLFNHRIITGEAIKVDTERDLALIKADPKYLDFYKEHFFNLGNSDLIQVGQEVFAIGHPFGIDWTVTRGIISAIRAADEYNLGPTPQFMIQTDASINPGNSGGALVDSQGNLFGINTMILPSQSATSIGIGFAIASNEVKQFIEEALNNKVVNKKPLLWIGINIQSILYEKYKKQDHPEITLNSFYIEDVIPGGPAEKTEIKTGDIIVAVDQKEFLKSIEFFRYINSKNANDSIILEIVRDSKLLQITVIIETKPENALKDNNSLQQPPKLEEPKVWIGMSFSILANELKLLGKLHQKNSLVQASHFVILEIVPGSPAEKAGLQKEDVIIGYDEEKPQGEQKFMNYLAQKKSGDIITLAILRDTETKIITITLEDKP